MKSIRLTETSNLILSLYDKLIKIQPAHGIIGSSTKLVVQINENLAGSRNIGSNNKFILQINES